MDKLDLTQPIKAHHRDGRIVDTSAMPNVTWWDGKLHHCAIGKDGLLETECGDWTLRNVIPAKPSTPSNEELTQRMEIAPETQARMVALVRRMAEDTRRCFTAELDEARSIVSHLPKPVDPIETRVTEIMRDHEIAPDDTGVRAAIRFALAAGGTAHE